ncbi:hypothetical protein HYU92_01600 [Candidatus Curtissbacteria bacterium]|nr:hypothetical protein [Candidatus Curtissbacteria bacterium]
MGRLKYFLLSLLLVIAVFVTASIFGQKSPTARLPAGYQKALELSQKYQPFQYRQTINYQLKGILKEKTETSWTIEKDGQTQTITSEAAFAPTFISRSKASLNLQKVEDSDLTLGLPVTISVSLDPASGQIAVQTIIIE